MPTPPKMFGIWIPGLGWLKAIKQGGGEDAYATLDREVADRLAGRLGNGARVEYIDDALAMLEDKLIYAETQPRWWQFWKKRR